MTEKNFEYKSIRIKASEGCMVTQRLIDLSLDRESIEGWELFTIFTHSCYNSDSCLVAIFKREARI
ncbi:MAG: hypothetical protein VR72_02400 [Clostridiaceae bacterium BRH_c20a]|nr:MAG: hypothetical protein VR72_02400 [Clostridiaceae bacterium BRH_c20a]